MGNSLYSCPGDCFSSPHKDSFSSFVEYKVNVNGCVPESFLPVLRRFDQYCCTLPSSGKIPGRDAVHGFLKQHNVKKSTLQRTECILRSFGKYAVLVLHAPDAYVLPRTVRNRGKTFVPYVFDTSEISRLFTAADGYSLVCRNKPTVNLENCMRCIIKVLYCTGMRVSEACHLTVSQVDLNNRVIHISHAKNDNHRIVTISGSLLREINKYMDESRRYRLSGCFFFDSGSPANNGRVSEKCVYSYFRRYLKLAGIEHGGTGLGPRLHDLRVTFAVHSLKKLTDNAEDVNACLSYLSVFMGHQSLLETQEYLWLCPELFEGTLSRMDDYSGFLSEIFDGKEGGRDD